MLNTIAMYALAALAVTTAVSSGMHLVGLDKGPKGQLVLKVCFDIIGLLKGISAMGQIPPAS